MLDDHGWTPSNLARSYTDVCCTECLSIGQTTTQTLRSHICKTVNSLKKKIWYGIQPAKCIYTLWENRMLSSKHDQNKCFEEIIPHPRINGTGL